MKAAGSLSPLAFLLFLAWPSLGSLSAGQVAVGAVVPATSPTHERLDVAETAAVATNGSLFFVVWKDHRADCGIYGTRVTASGEVLDPHGIKLSEQCGDNDRHPEVVWSGESFVVAWDSQLTDRKYLRHVSAEGRMLESSPILLPVPLGCWRSSVAATPSTRMILHGYYPPGAALLNVGGTVTRRIDRAGVEAEGSCADMVLASDGSSYAVADFVGSRIILNLFTEAGESRLSSPRIISVDDGGSTPNFPLMVGTPHGFSLYWSDRSADYKNRVRGLWLDHDGKVIRDPFVVHEGLADNGFYVPTGATPVSPTEELVVWLRWSIGGHSTFGKRLSRSLVPFASPLIELGDGRSDGVASIGEISLIVFTEGRFNLKLVRIPASGMAEQITTVAGSSAATRQTTVAAATGSAGTVACWFGPHTEGGDKFMCGRVAPGVTDAGPVHEIATVTTGLGGLIPLIDIASDGTGFLSVWSDGRPNSFSVEMNFRMIAPDGRPTGTAAGRLGIGYGAPAVTWNGSAYVVAWTDLAGRLRVTRVDAHGNLRDPEGVFVAQKLVDFPDIQQIFPAVASNGGTTVVSWQEGDLPQSCPVTCPTPPAPVIRWVALGQDFSRIPTPQTLPRAWADRPIRPALASVGSSYLLSWADQKSPSAASVAVALLRSDGSRVSETPTLLGSTPSSFYRTFRRSPTSIARLGSHYLVTWTGMLQCPTEPTTCFDIDAALVSAETGLPIGAAFKGAGGLENEVQPEVVTTGENRALLLYDRTSSEPWYGGVTRIFHRVIGGDVRARGARRVR